MYVYACVYVYAYVDVYACLYGHHNHEWLVVLLSSFDHQLTQHLDHQLSQSGTAHVIYYSGTTAVTLTFRFEEIFERYNSMIDILVTFLIIKYFLY